jgi:hypothetical protein
MEITGERNEWLSDAISAIHDHYAVTGFSI